jgi:hypothetical protein
MNVPDYKIKSIELPHKWLTSPIIFFKDKNFIISYQSIQLCDKALGAKKS